jgi:twinkle protein
MARASRAGFDQVLYTEPCPKCGSPDNVKVYADGHKKCWSGGCDYYEPGQEAPLPEGSRRDAPAPQGRGQAFLKPKEGAKGTAKEIRAIKPEVRERCGSFLATMGKEPVVVYPHRKDGEVVLQKCRTKDKDFPLIKGPNAPGLAECDLYGKHLFGDRFDRRLIITEGEEDMHAVAQVIDFKTAVVSITAGAQSAAKNLKANWRWIDRFAEVVLWFDADEAGYAAALECAKLFAIGKVRLAKAPGFKDANEALLAGKPGDVEAAIYRAETYRPRGIVNARDLFDKDFPEGEALVKPAWSYPWKFLNEVTAGGLHMGEIVYWVAGTGIGKSTFLNEVEYAAANQGLKVGKLHFEETRQEAQLGILSIAAERRLTITPIPREELRDLHKKVFGGGMYELFDPSAAEWNMEAIQGYIRYLAKALDCRVVMADPLSFIVAAEDSSDPVRALDKTAVSLAMLAHELNIHLGVSHHLARPKEGPGHEEGGEISLSQVRGSNGIAQFAHAVIGVERDQQGQHPNLNQFRMVKNRLFGFTGVAGVVEYDPLTGRLTERRDLKEIPKRAGKGGQSRGKGQGFGQAPEIPLDV